VRSQTKKTLTENGPAQSSMVRSQSVTERSQSATVKSQRVRSQREKRVTSQREKRRPRKARAAKAAKAAKVAKERDPIKKTMASQMVRDQQKVRSQTKKTLTENGPAQSSMVRSQSVTERGQSATVKRVRGQREMARSQRVTSQK